MRNKMNKKIKISFVDEDGKEPDYIIRNIPEYINYNFSKGILIDLLLLISRNELNIDLANSIEMTIYEIKER